MASLQLYLHKILPVFLLPVGITLLLVLAGLLLRRQGMIWTGVAVLWLGSTPVISHIMIRSMEGWAERSQAIGAPHADAIVVLSGGRLVAPGAAAISEWSDADRFYGGVELFQAGKAPLLVFTGGWAPWEPTAKPEGEITIEFAKALGVPANSMITTGAVANTAEEAQAVAALLDRKIAKGKDRGAKFRILLVTSAYHMKRAQWLFERAGLQVIPFPVDFQVAESGGMSVIDLLPGTGGLGQTDRALRELYGRFFYSLAG